MSGQFNLEKVSWGAIWAGVMVTIGMEALFLAFGIFINAVLTGSTIWTMAWYLVTMGVSFFAGAWTAARLSDVPVRRTSILHGLSTWGLGTLATVVIGGLAGWAALSLGTRVALSRAPAAIPSGVPWSYGDTVMWGGLIWGGIMLSLMTAYLGGATGVPSAPAETVQETGTGPTRRAA